MSTAIEVPKVLFLEIKDFNTFPKQFIELFDMHLLCLSGSFEFMFNSNIIKCNKGEFVFWFAGSNVKLLSFSKGFKAMVLLVENKFLANNVPDQSLGIEATLHSRKNPVLHLNDSTDKDRVIANFKSLNQKFEDRKNHFYDEILRLQMRVFILEMWHIFSSEFEKYKHSTQTGSLYERFVRLLEQHCMQEREVKFYSEKLFITPKYLNYICKTSTGVTASEWIQRYAGERIELLFQNPSISIAEIADEMEFSSRSFFTRYVKKVLGVTPSEFRKRVN